jgi:hypothetical protein
MPEKRSPTSVRLPNIKPASQVVQMTLDAHGGRRNLTRAADSVSEGTITLYNVQGPQVTFPMTLLRKGAGQVQRIIRQPGGEARQGTDGSRMWDGFAGMSVPTGSRVPQLVETQTTRSIAALFDHQARNATLRDDGVKHADRILAVEEEDLRTTRYFIDSATSRVTGIEFVSGQSRNMLSGKPVPKIESYAFSEFRLVGGVWTPFKVEHFSDGIKIEEMRFTSVRHNAPVKDDAFRP